MPPPQDWEDVQRLEYEPDGCGARNGKGTSIVELRITLRECKDYLRTWSSFYSWQKEHPKAVTKDCGGQGDVVDSLFGQMVESEKEWNESDDWNSLRVNIEWRSVLLVAKRKSTPY